MDGSMFRGLVPALVVFIALLVVVVLLSGIFIGRCSVKAGYPSVVWVKPDGGM